MTWFVWGIYAEPPGPVNRGRFGPRISMSSESARRLVPLWGQYWYLISRLLLVLCLFETEKRGVLTRSVYHGRNIIGNRDSHTRRGRDKALTVVEECQ